MSIARPPRSELREPPAGRAPVEHGRTLFWNTLGRLVLLYFLPLLLLAGYFQVQRRQLVESGRRAHLEITAEHHARLFDVFLRERVGNLRNLAADPGLDAASASPALLAGYLEELQHTSDAFVDLALVAQDGGLLAYAGPIVYGDPVNYAREPWFQTLISGSRSELITDIYLGFRNRPHFTIALAHGTRQGRQILRAALSPERLFEYLRSLEGAADVQCAVVNPAGVFQMTTPQLGHPLVASGFLPPRTPPRGYMRAGQGVAAYGYGWLTETEWALVATPAPGTPLAAGMSALEFLLPILAVFALMGVVILVRTRQVVGRQLASEQHEAELSGQLVHAARLASVGELAAGIAHEINNPLAIIAEEVGELQDTMDPSLPPATDEPIGLGEHLEIIREAVFRCRDITRQLLLFVRQTDVQIATHSLHRLLDDVVEVMLGNELLTSNIHVVRDYDLHDPEIVADRNQLVQVFVNLVKNAMDAMPHGGRLGINTNVCGGEVAVSVRDTGCGMSPEQLQRVFTPFFTTKAPGKGTGLGLSVSYTIVQNLGGSFYADSSPGRGSVFTVTLPVAQPARSSHAAAAASSERSPWQHA